MARLSDICLKIGSGATPTGGKSAYLMKGISLIRSQNVLDISFAEDGLAYISDEQARKLQNVEILEGDILLNITGDSVARVCIVPNHILPARVNQHVAIIRVDKTKADNNYILYSLIKSKKTLLALASAGSTRNALTKKMIEEFEVFLPSLAEQKRIASILSSLDDKIAVNRRINANLEAQAEALFKSWFVDFTPFKDQPFVDSELGPIPQGWKVGKADDFYKINIGKTPPRKEKEWFSKNESDNKWISISDMGNCGLFISNSAEKLTNAAIKKFNISLVPVNTILLSFKLTIGRVAISDCDLTTNEAIARFILPDECYLEFSFLMLKLYNYSTLGSTSSIATAVNSKIIKSMKMVMPSLKVLEDFHTITNPLFEKIRFTQKENQRLAALRDTLLPKLMSGEIKL